MRQLFTKEPLTFFIVIGIVAAQLFVASKIRDLSFGTCFINQFLTSRLDVLDCLRLWRNHKPFPAARCSRIVSRYVLGGPLGQSRDLDHCEFCDRFVPGSCFAFLPLPGFPSAITFRRYHMEHHMFQVYSHLNASTHVPRRRWCRHGRAHPV